MFNIFKITFQAVKRMKVIFLILIIFGFSISSCSLFRRGAKSDAKAQSEMQKRQNDAIDKEVKKYDKLYNEQTERQGKQQKEMIKKSRKRPKHMNSPKMKKPKKKRRKKMGMKSNQRRFFLWRWLGI